MNQEAHPAAGTSIDESGVRSGSDLKQLWNDRHLLFRIFSFIRPYKGWQALGLLLTLVAAGLGLVQPWISRLLIDKVLIEKNTSMLLEICLVFLGATLLSSVVRMASSLLFNWMGQITGNDLRVVLHGKLTQLSIAYTGKKKTGELLSSFTSDIPVIQGLYTSTLSTIVSQIGTFFIVLAVMLRIDTRLTLLAVPSIPVFAAIIALSGAMLKKASAEVQNRTASFTGLLQEQLTALKTSAAFGTEKREAERFGGSLGELLKSSIMLTLKGYVVEAGSLLATITLILAIWLGGKEVIAGRMQIGVLIAFISYFGMLFGPIGTLAGISTQMIRALGAAERVFGILDTEPAVKEKKDAGVLENARGVIEFRNVRFAYPGGMTVIDCFNATFRPGEPVLLKGNSGVGKTTIVSLLLRYFDPDEGVITIDGKDIRDFTLESLRRNIGVVFQDSFLYHASVRENIRIGNPDASEDDIRRAALAADAHSFINELPKGYDTVVGERGSSLSGGQAQRIALARVFLKNPRIVVLDEATSALDPTSEGRIHETMKAFLSEKTSIVITHHGSFQSHPANTRCIEVAPVL